MLDEFLKLTNQSVKVASCPTLEVGSILTLIHVACLELGLPVYERDILNSARDNSIGFLTSYR